MYVLYGINWQLWVIGQDVGGETWLAPRGSCVGINMTSKLLTRTKHWPAFHNLKFCAGISWLARYTWAQQTFRKRERHLNDIEGNVQRKQTRRIDRDVHEACDLNLDCNLPQRNTWNKQKMHPYKGLQLRMSHRLLHQFSLIFFFKNPSPTSPPTLWKYSTALNLC